MRIAYASRTYGPHDFRFLTAAAEAGHDVSHILVGAGNRSESRPSPAEQHTYIVGSTALPTRVDEISRVLECVDPHVIHAGPLQEVTFPVILAAGDRPVIAMSWGSDLLLKAQQDALWADVAGYTLSRSAWFIGDCAATEDAARELGFRGPSTIFPWGVDVARFKPDGPRYKFDAQGPAILSTRNWEPLYDLATLATAFTQLTVPSHLLLAGGGSQESWLREILEAETAAQHVTWLGRTAHDKLPEFYRGAAVYASTSTSDGSSVSLLEAMGCGLPVIVSDTPANREWVSSGENGLLFRVGDPRSLAVALEQLLELTSKERKKMGLAGRARVLERADWRANRAKLLKVYTEVAK